MKCYLCLQGEIREIGHIIPKFAFKWLKESSPTGFFRGTSNPNKREQDGWKQFLLCPRCEDRLSSWENIFAKRVFHRVHRGRLYDLKFDYDDWLLKFAVSLSWRALLYWHLREGIDDLPFGHGRIAKEALETWRRYLNEETVDIHPYQQHLLIFGDTVSTKGIANTRDLHNLVARGIEFNTIHSSSEAYIFTKICRILVAGTIIDSNPSQWAGTLIEKSGFFGGQSVQVSSCVFTFMETEVKELQDGRGRISPRQNTVIDEAVRDNFNGGN